MGYNGSGYPSGVFGKSVGPGPSPKPAHVLEIPSLTIESNQGIIGGWVFPLFDESTSAVVRMRNSSGYIEDINLIADDEETLSGESDLNDICNLIVIDSAQGSFLYTIDNQERNVITLELLSLDHNGQQVFP